MCFAARGISKRLYSLLEKCIATAILVLWERRTLRLRSGQAFSPAIEVGLDSGLQPRRSFLKIANIYAGIGKLRRG
jgi:hypothetical protein